MFGSSLPPVVGRMSRVLFTLFCVCLRIVVSNTYRDCVFVCLRLVSCVPNVANFSGYSILDCLCGFLIGLFNHDIVLLMIIS